MIIFDLFSTIIYFREKLIEEKRKTTTKVKKKLIKTKLREWKEIIVTSYVYMTNEVESLDNHVLQSLLLLTCALHTGIFITIFVLAFKSTCMYHLKFWNIFCNHVYNIIKISLKKVNYLFLRKKKLIILTKHELNLNFYDSNA